MAGELQRLSSTDILIPYRGWVWPETSGVSQPERQTAAFMYSAISSFITRRVLKGMLLGVYQ